MCWEEAGSNLQCQHGIPSHSETGWLLFLCWLLNEPYGKMIERVKEALEQDSNHKIKLVLDHMKSALNMILPVSALIELCHKHDVQV